MEPYKNNVDDTFIYTELFTINEVGPNRKKSIFHFITPTLKNTSIIGQQKV